MKQWSPFAPTQQPLPAMPPGRIEELPTPPEPRFVETFQERLPAMAAVDIVPWSHPINGTLCEQIGAVVGQRTKQRGGKVVLMNAASINAKTLLRVISGVGITVNTLERLCPAMGWTVTITDKDGHVVGLSNPQGQSPPSG